MLLIVFNIFWIANLVCVLLKKKNRALSVATFIFLCIIYFYNTQSNDYERYIWIYGGEIRSEIEPGFLFVLDVFSRLGYTFQQIQGIIATICLFTIIIVYRKFSDNYHLFFTFYLIYQYFADLNLLRNFVMRTFIFVAIYFLINGKRMHFVILLVVAMLFHRTALIYLPLALINPEKKISPKLIKMFAGIILTGCVTVFIFGNNWTWIYNIAARFLSDEVQKLSYYFTTTTHYGFLIYFGLHLINFYVVLTMRRKELENDKLQKWTTYLNYYSFLFFPLIMLNNNFYRLYNNLYLINLVCYVKNLDSYSKTTTGYYKCVLKVLIANYIYRLPVVQAWDQKFKILEVKK